ERGVREKMLIITKVGMEVAGKSGLKKSHIDEAIKDSLTRLQTDYVDAYLAHKEDTTTPIEESLEAFKKIQEKGMAKIIGASNYSFEGLEKAVKVAKENGLAEY